MTQNPSRSAYSTAGFPATVYRPAHAVGPRLAGRPAVPVATPLLRRNKRLNASLLVIATALGLWFGIAAPDTSPVAPSVAVSSPAAVVPALPLQPRAFGNRGR
jgi:hypothetical protein